jgi:hypothetical protein
MTSLLTLGRTVTLAIVIAGVVLFTVAVQGVTSVDTRLELAAARQAVPAKVADCPFRDHGPRSDRERV